jgi:hypothetical protein
VRSRISHPLGASLALALLVVLLSIGGLAATASQPSRSSLLSSLRRPATFAAASVGPGRVATVTVAGPYRLAVRLTPNRAGLRNRVSFRVTQGGRPLAGAHLTVVYSMPAMNMWQALSTPLAPTRAGTYRADVPALGMPGLWQLKLHLATAGARSVDLTIDDQMRS